MVWNPRAQRPQDPPRAVDLGLVGLLAAESTRQASRRRSGRGRRTAISDAAIDRHRGQDQHRDLDPERSREEAGDGGRDRERDALEADEPAHRHGGRHRLGRADHHHGEQRVVATPQPNPSIVISARTPRRCRRRTGTTGRRSVSRSPPRRSGPLAREREDARGDGAGEEAVERERRRARGRWLRAEPGSSRCRGTRNRRAPSAKLEQRGGEVERRERVARVERVADRARRRRGAGAGVGIGGVWRRCRVRPRCRQSRPRTGEEPGLDRGVGLLERLAARLEGLRPAGRQRAVEAHAALPRARAHGVAPDPPVADGPSPTARASG